MSYAHPSTTNNHAEYLGLIAGLKAATRHGWKVEVVGDSALILRQLRLYRPPKHPRLLPLYAVARRLADELKVREWHHHLRAFNKMADHMANVAMDLKRSIQALHTHQWPHHEQLHRLLATDFQEWQSRYLLRDSQR